MVKDKTAVPEVCLDYRKPLAREYNERKNELVTEPDVSLSLTQMVITGTVKSANPNYVYPDLPDDDDEAHDRPDYEKLNALDIVEKENYVDEWLQKPENYEKREEETPKTTMDTISPASNKAEGANDPE